MLLFYLEKCVEYGDWEWSGGKEDIYHTCNNIKFFKKKGKCVEASFSQFSKVKCL